MSASIVIRCVGRERLFSGVLQNLLRQTAAPSEILIVMDSKSAEETRYVRRHLERYPKCRLLTFSHEDFSHPYSANLGVAHAGEELVCMTNGHSLPVSYNWLERGLKHFDDENVAGVSGFFLPSSEGLGKNLFYLVEGPMKQINWISTINCVIRKSRWKEYPFDENLPGIIPETREYGGEDYDWTLEMLSRGYKIVMDAEFSVIHFHESDFIFEIIRNLRNYFTYKRLREKIKNIKRPRRSFRLLTEPHTNTATHLSLKTDQR